MSVNTLVYHDTNMDIQVYKNDIGYFVVLSLILFPPTPF